MESSSKSSPNQSHEWETTDILICGGGPIGTALSAYLGRMGIKNVVLEKQPHIPPDPRAFSMGEEGIRVLQGAGLYDYVFTDIGQCVGTGMFISGRQTDVNKEPFFSLDMSLSDGGTGHPTGFFFRQPVMEKHLRDSIASSPSSELRSQSTVTSISEDEDWVYVQYMGANGDTSYIKSKFLVGADGKTGFVRKMYLEPRGVVMEKTHDYEDTWMSVNYQLTIPTKTTHPDFPLWGLGYSPDQVSEAFFPDGFRMFANLDRFGACGLIGPRSDGLYRFEFAIVNGEDPKEMADPKRVREIVSPYLTHSGQRYGLTDVVKFPDDCLTIRQARPYTYQARTCNVWALDRVLLIGDAAHVFPPFGGQGINCGFLDAIALAWRLRLVLRPDFLEYKLIFAGWCLERKQHVLRALAYTVENGDLLTEKNPFKIFLRDWLMWSMQFFSAWKKWRQKGISRQGMMRYRFAPGMAFLSQYNGGRSFPQAYCVPMNTGATSGEVTFTDDVIFPPDKRGTFQLIVFLDNATQIATAAAAIQSVDDLSDRELLAKETTYVILDTREPGVFEVSDGVTDVVRLATAEEFAKSRLCLARPEPIGYDALRIWHEMDKKKYVVVRPDRFVFAACSDKAELEHAASHISRVLRGEDGRI